MNTTMTAKEWAEENVGEYVLLKNENAPTANFGSRVYRIGKVVGYLKNSPRGRRDTRIVLVRVVDTHPSSWTTDCRQYNNTSAVGVGHTIRNNPHLSGVCVFLIPSAVDMAFFQISLRNIEKVISDHIASAHNPGTKPAMVDEFPGLAKEIERIRKVSRTFGSKPDRIRQDLRATIDFLIDDEKPAPESW